MRTNFTLFNRRLLYTTKQIKLEVNDAQAVEYLCCKKADCILSDLQHFRCYIQILSTRLSSRHKFSTKQILMICGNTHQMLMKTICSHLFYCFYYKCVPCGHVCLWRLLRSNYIYIFFFFVSSIVAYLWPRGCPFLCTCCLLGSLCAELCYRLQFYTRCTESIANVIKALGTCVYVC